MSYSKEQMKELYEDDLKAIYQEMLEEEKANLEEINKEWNVLKDEMLRAIAKYDVATKGGKKADLNTLNVEIITKMEKFRTCNEDPVREKKANEVEANIKALEFLMNL